MTLGELKRRIRTDGRELPGTPAFDDDERVMEQDIFDAVDDIAGKTDCYAPQLKTSIVADQTTYCGPNYYKLKSALSLNSIGKYEPLIVKNVDWADGRSAGWWRNLNSSSWTYAALFRGQNQFDLVPTPSVSVTQGLIFEGYAKPGLIWAYDDDDLPLPITDASTPPLPTWAQDGNIIVHHVLSRRHGRYPRVYGAEPDYKASMYREGLYKEALADVAGNAMVFIERAAGQGYPGY